jgi:tripeptidyl-peptidase-1
MSTITPSCLQALYNMPTAMATQQSNTLGVSGFIGQYANQADLRSFILSMRPDMSPATTFAGLGLDGGGNPQRLDQAGIEANLDIQYTVGLAQGVPVTFVSVGEDNGDGLGGFLDIVVALMTLDRPPQVLTTSYGQDESAVSSQVAL